MSRFFSSNYYLVQLVDDLILTGNFIVQAANGVVPVGFLLFDLCDGHVDIIDVLLDGHNLLLQDLFVSRCLLTGSLFCSESVLSVLQFCFASCDSSCGLGLLEMKRILVLR